MVSRAPRLVRRNVSITAVRQWGVGCARRCVRWSLAGEVDSPGRVVETSVSTDRGWPNSQCSGMFHGHRFPV